MQRWLDEEDMRKDSPRDAMNCGYIQYAHKRCEI